MLILITFFTAVLFLTIIAVIGVALINLTALFISVIPPAVWVMIFAIAVWCCFIVAHTQV